MKKSEKDKARPGIMQAISGAEAHALPFLEAVSLEAWSALRVARDAVSGEVYPAPGEHAFNAELTAFDAATVREKLSRAHPGSAWLLRHAVVAALFFATDNLDEARQHVARVLKVTRAKEKAEAEREKERTLGAYQEAFYALRRGEVPLKLVSGEDADERRVEVELVGATRACGGVVIVHDTPMYAGDWTAAAQRHPDAYVRDLAHKVDRAVSDAMHRAKPE